jgi:hypothetical protein
MKSRIVCTTVLLALAPTASATDTGAVGNGDWSSAATWTNGVPGASDSAFIGSTYPSGAAANAVVTLSGNSTVGNVSLGNDGAGTLDLAGSTLSANFLDLAPSGSIRRTGGGTISVSAQFEQDAVSFSFAASDVAFRYYLTSGATGTTISPSNVTNRISVDAGGTLNLGADLGANDLDLNGVLNANGYALKARYLTLGGNPNGYTVNNRGDITAATVDVFTGPGQTPFVFRPSDSVTQLTLFGGNTALPSGFAVPDLFLNPMTLNSTLYYATAQTTTSSNINGLVDISSGCSIILGSDLNASDIFSNGILNANYHAISVTNVSLGLNNSPPATLVNDGNINVAIWEQAGGTHIRFHQPGDALGSLLLSEGAILEMQDVGGQAIGLSIGSTLSIDPGSELLLEINGDALGWILRWTNNPHADHIADIQNLINANEITFSYLNGGSYSLSSDGTYTYVNVIPAPEPSTLLLTAAAGGILLKMRRKEPRTK